MGFSKIIRLKTWGNVVFLYLHVGAKRRFLEPFEFYSGFGSRPIVIDPRFTHPRLPRIATDNWTTGDNQFNPPTLAVRIFLVPCSKKWVAENKRIHASDPDAKGCVQTLILVGRVDKISLSKITAHIARTGFTGSGSGSATCSSTFEFFAHPHAIGSQGSDAWEDIGICTIKHDPNVYPINRPGPRLTAVAHPPVSERLTYQPCLGGQFILLLSWNVALRSQNGHCAGGGAGTERGVK